MLVCAPPPSVYEGSDDVDLDCSASGGPEGSAYEYVWTARGSTPDVSLLSAANIASPTFYVPAEADEDEIYEYLLTVSAQNTKDATAEVTVTVLNKSALAITCADPPSVYERLRRHRLRLRGVGGACRFYLRILLDASGQYAGRVAPERSGHRLADLLRTRRRWMRK